MTIPYAKEKKEFEKKFECIYISIHDYEKCDWIITGKCTCSAENEKNEFWSWILSLLTSQREEVRKEAFDLFNEILNDALDDREMADDPKDPKIRIAWLKKELEMYLSTPKEGGKEGEKR